MSNMNKLHCHIYQHFHETRSEHQIDVIIQKMVTLCNMLYWFKRNKFITKVQLDVLFGNKQINFKTDQEIKKIQIPWLLYYASSSPFVPTMPAIFFITHNKYLCKRWNNKMLVVEVTSPDISQIQNKSFILCIQQLGEQRVVRKWYTSH